MTYQIPPCVIEGWHSWGALAKVRPCGVCPAGVCPKPAAALPEGQIRRYIDPSRVTPTGPDHVTGVQPIEPPDPED